MSTELLFLTVAEVLALHRDQLLLFGGADGIRDAGMLQSAVASPMSTFDGVFLHEDIFQMAAAYAFHLAENQPFLDGNKRTALNAALVFLDINGWLVLDPEKRLYDAMISLSTHELDKHGLARLLCELATPLDENQAPENSRQ